MSERFLIFHLTFPDPGRIPRLGYPGGPLPLEVAEAASDGRC